MKVRLMAVAGVLLALVMSVWAAEQSSEESSKEARGEPKRKGPTPRDASKAMHINEKGFPLNIDPKIVGADDSPIGSG